MNKFFFAKEFGVSPENLDEVSREMMISYMLVLKRVAEVNGINEAEQVALDYVRAFADIDDIDSLAAEIGSPPGGSVPISKLLAVFDSDYQPTLQKYVVRDCIRIALADEQYDAEEKQMVEAIADELEIPQEEIDAIFSWVVASNKLEDEWETQILGNKIETR